MNLRFSITVERPTLWRALSTACVCCANTILWAEAGILVVNVRDVHKHPVVGLEIGVEGTVGRL